MDGIDGINQLSDGDFIASLGGVYEHSPWVAGRALAHRPFADRTALTDCLRDIVDNASDEEKLTLIRAHPDLAGKLARAGTLTAESTREQAGLGLDRLSDAEFGRFTELNQLYRGKFGFPFVICARMTTKPGVLAAFETRLENESSAEIHEALVQIHHIARLRLEDLLA
jgi:2-oxo-4-hydroxy-4-carboxy-5-ureidoimidazoline decarboxylase